MTAVHLMPKAAVLTVYVQEGPTHQFVDAGHDMESGLWLPSGWQNRCQAVTKAGAWCSRPVIPKNFWLTESASLRWYVMTKTGYAAMESMRCHLHREAAS